MDGSTIREVNLQTGRERWDAHLAGNLVISPVPSADRSTGWASGEAVIGGVTLPRR